MLANKQNIRDEVYKVVGDKMEKALRQGITQNYVEGLRDRIVTRTRLGIGINPDTGAGEKLKRLAPITKRIRRNEARIFSNKSGGKLVFTDGSDSIGLTRKGKKAKKEAFRERFGKVTLSDKTTPAKSNLTATGQLLNSLTVIKLKLKKSWGFRISVSDRRGRDMFGKSPKPGFTNKVLLKYLADQGRRFFGFTKSQRNKINKEIRNFILKGLK